MDDLTTDELTLIATVINNLYSAAVRNDEDPGLLETISIKLEDYANVSID